MSQSGRGGDEVATVPDPEAQRGFVAALAIGRYDIGARIGKGGMGEVFLARDVSIGRDVAIKRMLTAGSERAAQRFMREARIQARLDHPAIVPVHDLGLDANEMPYIVMKRLSGKTMRAVLGTEVSKQSLLRAFVDVCFAVEYAHTRGVVHRDLKPENIMLGELGEVYVLDWGVAKVVGVADIETDLDSQTGEYATRAGSVIGTPEYMAPEQARGEPVDARADVYALGRILLELLTGRDVAAARPSAIARDVPVELDELCARALVEDREQRLQAAVLLAQGVQAYLDGDRDLEQRRTLASAHLAQAQTALADGDEPEQRSLAMREAGRALALDPTRTDAADLIGKLMIEPPRVVPPAVERELEEERMTLLRGNAHVAAASFVAVIAFTVGIAATTHAAISDIIAIDVLALCMLGVTMLSRRQTAPLRSVYLFAAIALTSIVVLFSRLYPPFLAAPVIASQMALAVPFTMQHDRRWYSIMLAVLLIAGAVVPYLGEYAGLWASTFTFREDGVLMHTAALRGSELAQIVITTTYLTVTVAFAGYIGYVTRQSERGARRQVRLQAWHLRQLVS